VVSPIGGQENESIPGRYNAYLSSQAWKFRGPRSHVFFGGIRQSGRTESNSEGARAEGETASRNWNAASEEPQIAAMMLVVLDVRKGPRAINQRRARIPAVDVWRADGTKRVGVCLPVSMQPITLSSCPEGPHQALELRTPARSQWLRREGEPAIWVAPPTTRELSLYGYYRLRCADECTASFTGF